MAETSGKVVRRYVFNASSLIILLIGYPKKDKGEKEWSRAF
jgi:hypothetical protein